MSVNDTAGRIHKAPFARSVVTLFVITLILVAGRFAIRIGLQRTFSIDDGFLLFGVLCLIAAVVLLFQLIDKMYLGEALLFGTPVALPPDFIEQALDFHKLVTVCLILLWIAVCAAKFSFLFFFRKLIDRIRIMIIYWWIVLVFCVLTMCYGIAAYVLSCPKYGSLEAVSCSNGPTIKRTLTYSAFQLATDIVSDLLILYIPVRLVWKIQIRWQQKFWLLLTLGLTVVMVVVTITRAAGLRHQKILDNVWGVYWMFVAAEVALMMTSIAAFRSLFVELGSRWQRQEHGDGEGSGSSRRYSNGIKRLRRLMVGRSWRSKSSSSSPSSSLPSSQQDVNNKPRPEDLGEIPHGTMSGIRTFIQGHRKSRGGLSQIMQSRVMERDEEEGVGDIQMASTGSPEGRAEKGINVQHHIRVDR
ncbi:MAG: hypothetical protein M1823_003134 [Watsoniomyces obsoletus]|nr:MAG: hypothetical protein M1823_003134 [Watsoniomyces obsoletus]